jgi:MYXO-CTERM domain-containing protein
MKTYKPFLLGFSLICATLSAQAQGFVNLDFEQSTIVSSNYDSGGGFYYGTANVSGWTGMSQETGSTTNLFGYNFISLGTPNVTLVDAAWGSIDGAFSMQLEAFSTGVAISQIGSVPASAESLLFEAPSGAASGGLQVSLGGQTLTFLALSSGANYTLYGANISTFAGQSERLTFSALPNYWWTIDDIQFSPSAVPEPSEFALGALGALLLAFRRRRNMNVVK